MGTALEDGGRHLSGVPWTHSSWECLQGGSRPFSAAHLSLCPSLLGLVFSEKGAPGAKPLSTMSKIVILARQSFRWSLSRALAHRPGTFVGLSPQVLWELSPS